MCLDNVPPCRGGGMVDATDSKSVVRKGVWVRVPLPVQSYRLYELDAALLPAWDLFPGQPCSKSTSEIGEYGFRVR